MPTEYPPLGKSFVLSYSSNDKHYPIVCIVKDPRVDNYKIPDDLSPHPDKVRWPNHVFTGTQPTSSDQRVRWIYELLPSPWVPTSRYDDDLGSVNGRRRWVKNEGQQATLSASSRVVYEGRDGQATVLVETEESWATVDRDGNSLFPTKCRDLYDASRGSVQECRQLVVTDGTETATLENIDGVITQTNYEIYNQYLSVKIIQKYNVAGPQLIGSTTDNSGLLATVTTQRKGSDGYVAPTPTATRTVDVTRDDAETVVERLVDLPKVFDQKVTEATRPDTIPDKFRAAQEQITHSITEAGSTIPDDIVLSGDDYSKTEQRLTEYTKKVTTLTKDNSSFPELDGQDYEEQFNIRIPYTEEILTSLPLTGAYDAEPIGDGRYFVRSYNLTDVDSVLSSYMVSFPTRASLDIPPVLESVNVSWDEDTSLGATTQDNDLSGQFNTLSQTDQAEVAGSVSAYPKFNVQTRDIWARNIMATTYIFFLKGPVTEADILAKIGAQSWPVFKPQSYTLMFYGAKVSGMIRVSASRAISKASTTAWGVDRSTVKSFNKTQDITQMVLDIKSCIHNGITISGSKSLSVEPMGEVRLQALSDSNGDVITPELVAIHSGQVDKTVSFSEYLAPTDPPFVPSSGLYMIDSNIDFYKYGYFVVRATVVDASQFA